MINYQRGRRFLIQLLLHIIIPIVIGVIIINNFVYFIIEKAGVEQIKDTLNNAYSIVRNQFQEPQKKGNFKTNVEKLRLNLSGPIAGVWIKAKNIEEFKNILKLFGFDSLFLKNLKFSENRNEFHINNIRIANYNYKKEYYELIGYFLSLAKEKYLKKSIQEQYELVSKSGYWIRIIRDLTKSGLRIRGSGYVWILTGNPQDNFQKKAIEIIHPFIESVDTWNTTNHLGEFVGRNISIMNGKIDKVSNKDIIRYDYFWKNPSDINPREKAVMIRYYKKKNWLICAGFYKDEFFAFAKYFRKYLYLLGFVLSIILIIRFFYKKSKKTDLFFLQFNIQKTKYPNRIFNWVVNTAISLVKADSGYLLINKNSEETIECKMNINEDVSYHYIQMICQENGSISVRENNESSEINKKQKSVLCVPVKVEKRSIGLCYLERDAKKGFFKDKDLVEVKRFFAEIALSIENIVLRQNSNNELDISEKQINSFCEQKQLTGREKQILEMIIKGYTNRRISKEIFISIGTVKNHITSIYKKTEIKNRSELISLIGR